MGDGSPSGGEASFTPHDLLLRGMRVRYHAAGEGPVVVLLHGVFVDHRVWLPTARRLAAAARVIVPDLPGAGASEKPTRYPFTREALADTVCDLLAGVSAPRAHVAGLGMGALVALTLAADRGEVVDRVAAVSPALGEGASLRVRVPAAPVVGPFVFKQLYNRAVLQGHLRGDVFAPGFRCDPALVDAWYDAFTTPEARECQWRMLVHAQADTDALGPRLRKVRAPTLVLWGDRAPRAPVTAAQRLAHELPAGRLEMIRGAGHAPPLERPEATAEALARHFAIPLPPAGPGDVEASG